MKNKRPNFEINSGNIFLLDGLGAVLSLTVTALILPMYSELLGPSKTLLYGMAMFPLIYGMYSLTCFFIFKKTEPWMLMGIMIGNLVYCLVSGVVMVFNKDITVWGQALLFVEVLVILAVVWIELKIYRKLNRI